MFENPGEDAGQSLADHVLSESSVQRVTVGLSAALSDPTGLDDAARIAAIRALEQLVCVATAAQAQLSAEFDASQRDAAALRGVPAARRGRGIAAQFAYARRESPHRGERHLGLAKVVVDELPHTWAAWRAGRITEWTATVIARETACVDLELRREIDRLVASDADKLEAWERERSRRSARRTADTHSANGDPGGRGQVMADALVEALTGSKSSTAISVGLVMTDSALFDGADDAAHLDGYGPIPAELAREIVARTLDGGDKVWIRRLYTHPETGELVSMDARSRVFRGGLRRFIRLRDQTCRTPWCDAPIRHTDHAHEAHTGGETTASNGQGLCEACNYAKQAHGWSARAAPGGAIASTTPTGHSYATRPRALIRIHERRLPRIEIDYVLGA